MNSQWRQHVAPMAMEKDRVADRFLLLSHPIPGAGRPNAVDRCRYLRRFVSAKYEKPPGPEKMRESEPRSLRTVTVQ